MNLSNDLESSFKCGTFSTDFLSKSKDFELLIPSSGIRCLMLYEILNTFYPLPSNHF